jgi:hypothetical protein
VWERQKRTQVRAQAKKASFVDYLLGERVKRSGIPWIRILRSLQGKVSELAFFPRTMAQTLVLYFMLALLCSVSLHLPSIQFVFVWDNLMALIESLQFLDK